MPSRSRASSPITASGAAARAAALAFSSRVRTATRSGWQISSFRFSRAPPVFASAFGPAAQFQLNAFEGSNHQVSPFGFVCPMSKRARDARSAGVNCAVRASIAATRGEGGDSNAGSDAPVQPAVQPTDSSSELLVFVGVSREGLLVRDQEVVGSNPISPTHNPKNLLGLFHFPSQDSV